VPEALARPEFLFDRHKEIEDLRRRLNERRSFLLYGPSGVGKTLLLQRVLHDFPQALYSPDSAAAQSVFRNLASGLLAAGDTAVLKAMARRGAEGIKSKSAVALKGMTMDALRARECCVVLDHLTLPSQSFAAAVREIMGWGHAPVIAVARSVHMEDVGFLQPFFSDRCDRFELRNFPPAVAGRFAQEAVRRAELSAENMGEFLDRVLEFSQGNPGAILSMLEMAKHPKYRSAEHIKITPLYLDFRLNWKPAGVQ